MVNKDRREKKESGRVHVCFYFLCERQLIVYESRIDVLGFFYGVCSFAVSFFSSLDSVHYFNIISSISVAYLWVTSINSLGSQLTSKGIYEL